MCVRLESPAAVGGSGVFLDSSCTRERYYTSRPYGRRMTEDDDPGSQVSDWDQPGQFLVYGGMWPTPSARHRAAPGATTL